MDGIFKQSLVLRVSAVDDGAIRLKRESKRYAFDLMAEAEWEQNGLT